jgi:hypothetical protein
MDETQNAKLRVNDLTFMPPYPALKNVFQHLSKSRYGLLRKMADTKNPLPLIHKANDFFSSIFARKLSIASYSPNPSELMLYLVPSFFITLMFLP